MNDPTYSPAAEIILLALFAAYVSWAIVDSVREAVQWLAS